jgi:hypothetical protein
MSDNNRTAHLSDGRELTMAEIEHVSGAAPAKGANNSQEFLVITLKEVFITSVSPSS